MLRSGTRIIARTTSSRRGRFRFVVSARAKPLSVVSPAGIGVVAAVTMNLYDFRSIIVAAAIGAVVALPVVWIVAKKLENA